jgi:hemerythrin-like domain-containing protein
MIERENPQTPLAPTAELKSEHVVIKRVLAVLESLVARARRGEGFEAEALADAVEFFRLFADACHHAKEEDLLFPVLEARGIPNEGGPIGVMLEEHRLARAYTREMGEALAEQNEEAGGAQDRFLGAADEYLALLTSHIFKEDNVLFQMGDRVLSDTDQADLGLKFCDVGCRAFDGKTREQLEAIADRLEAQWARG